MNLKMHCLVACASLMFLTTGCSQRIENQNKIVDSLTIDQPITDIAHCIPQIDSEFDDGIVIKAVVVGDHFDIAVGYKNNIKLIGFKFDCQTAWKYIPTVLRHKPKLLLLKCGSGANFREIFVCKVVGDSISINRFESERTNDAEFDFAYKNQSDREIYLIDKLGKYIKINTPSAQRNEKIVFSYIDRRILKTVFESGDTLSLKIPHSLPQ